MFISCYQNNTCTLISSDLIQACFCIAWHYVYVCLCIQSLHWWQTNGKGKEHIMGVRSWYCKVSCVKKQQNNEKFSCFDLLQESVSERQTCMFYSPHPPHRKKICGS